MSKSILSMSKMVFTMILCDRMTFHKCGNIKVKNYKFRQGNPILPAPNNLYDPEIMDSELRTKVEACCRTAEDFTKLYYTSFDKRRHQMSRLYLDNGLFVWNGNGASGKDNIQKYFIELPTSEHTITTLDAQPIVDEAVAGQLTYLIQAGGTVKYTEQPVKPFQQTFIITAQEDKWKIASDCYRLQDALATADNK